MKTLENMRRGTGRAAAASVVSFTGRAGPGHELVLGSAASPRAVAVSVAL